MLVFTPTQHPTRAKCQTHGKTYGISLKRDASIIIKRYAKNEKMKF